MRKSRWQELTRMVQDTGVDAFELNFSCPHGMTERKMGSEMGEHPDLCEEVTSWVTEVSNIPVWAKMTPNITNIKEPSLAAVRGGAVGISAINTILSVIGVDLNTLRPMPTVEGHTVPGGYSSQAVRPIALRMVSQLALGLPQDVSISGIGGIENSHDALEFMLLGSSTVQLCTGVMLHGVKMIDELKEGLEKFMVDKGFNSVQEIVGKSLGYFSTHMDLVQKMKAAKRTKAGEASRDNEWAPERHHREDRGTDLKLNEQLDRRCAIGQSALAVLRKGPDAISSQLPYSPSSFQSPYVSAHNRARIVSVLLTVGAVLSLASALVSAAAILLPSTGPQPTKRSATRQFC